MEQIHPAPPMARFLLDIPSRSDGSHRQEAFETSKPTIMKKLLPIIALTIITGSIPGLAAAGMAPDTSATAPDKSPETSAFIKAGSAQAIGPRASQEGKNGHERNTQKRKRLEDDDWIPEILANKTFAIEIDRLFLPMGIINLRHTWLMLVRDGHVEAGLPYWGRYSAPNLSIDHPLVVEVDAMAADYKVDTTRRGYEVNFKLYQVGETLEVELRINKNGYVSFYLYSSMRSDIRYSGDIKMVADKNIPFRQLSDQLW